MNKMALVRELQRLSYIKGFTQYKLAKKAGVHYNTVNRAFAGDKWISVDKLLKIARAMELDVDFKLQERE